MSSKFVRVTDPEKYVLYLSLGMLGTQIDGQVHTYPAVTLAPTDGIRELAQKRYFGILVEDDTSEEQ